MRKNFITEEYTNRLKAGTLIMKEQRHFFGSKMMDVEDEIRIDSGNDISLKKIYLSKPAKAVAQSASEIADYTKWEFTLNTNNLLRDTIYNRIWTTNSDFASISTENISTKRRVDAIMEYINNNLMRLYKLDRVIMWVSYYDLSLRKVEFSNETINLLQYTPSFSPNIKPTTVNRDTLAEKTFVTENNDGTHKITYKQTKSSRYTTYVYYMDFVFVRI